MTVTLERYMTRYPHTVDVMTTVDGARKLMLQLGVRHLPVVKDADLVGILSERDVAFAERAGAGAKRLEDVMSVDHPYAVDVRASLFDVAKTMADRRLGSAIVLKYGKVAGIFTAVDACRALADALRPQRASVPPVDEVSTQRRSGRGR